MTTKRLIIVTIAVLNSILGTIAAADEEEPAAIATRGSWLEDQHHELRVDAGAMYNLPTFGVTYAYAPIPQFKLEIGTHTFIPWFFGTISVMPKVALGSATDRFTAGVGVEFWFGFVGSAFDDGAIPILTADVLG